MASFAFFSYRPETWARLVAEPADRAPAVRQTVVTPILDAAQSAAAAFRRPGG